MTHTDQDTLRFRQLIGEYAQRIKRLSAYNQGFIVNKDWLQFMSDNHSPPCLAVVADNPGENERAKGVYLCRDGSAGRIAREFFDAVFGFKAVEYGRVIILNKSTYYTPRTSDLVKLVRNPEASPDLLQTLRDDQKENGRTVAKMAALLKIPVLILGFEKSDAFRSFKDTLDAEAGLLEILRGHTSLLDRTLARAFFNVPHFSHYYTFRRCLIPGWNSRFDAFVGANPSFARDSGNLSWARMRDCTEPMTIAKSYMFDVLLG